MTGGKHHLKKPYRQVMDAARDEADKFGASVDMVTMGRHPRIRLSMGDQIRLIPFAGTPRCVDHGPDHMRQRIRQKVREILDAAPENDRMGI